MQPDGMCLLEVVNEGNGLIVYMELFVPDGDSEFYFYFIEVIDPALLPSAFGEHHSFPIPSI